MEGARDVCGAAVVLATRVNQQQRVGIYRPAAEQDHKLPRIYDACANIADVKRCWSGTTCAVLQEGQHEPDTQTP